MISGGWSRTASSSSATRPRRETAGLEEAMRYSLLAGGKRIRPVLCLATARALGMDPEPAADRGGPRADPHLFADPRRPAGDGRRRPAPGSPDLARRLRRGRRDPGRRRAVRRGDQVGLRAARRARRGSSRRSGRSPPRPGSTGWSAASTWTSSAAASDPDALRLLHSLKTGKLISASVCSALALAGRDAAEEDPYRRFATELGLLFQIVDDILDVTGSDEQLGKPSGSDERHGKVTYVSLYGIERARELAEESHHKASRH